MLSAQKELLAGVRASSAAALKILQRGVKIARVVQHLRAAEAELDTRVRTLEKSAPAAPKVQPRKPVAPAPAPSAN